MALAHQQPRVDPDRPPAARSGPPVTPQPEVAVEDALNNIVTSDLSSVTLQVVSGPGTFSNTCSGVESYGIVQFSNCSSARPGHTPFEAVDSNSKRVATPSASVTVIPAPGRQARLHLDARHRYCLGHANAGPITVQEQDPFGNPTFSPVTVNLTSSSAAGVFSPTSGGPPVTSVTIPGGTVSTVSFYYGDTVAGTPPSRRTPLRWPRTPGRDHQRWAGCELQSLDPVAD